MSKEQMRQEKLYQATMSMVRKMLAEGLSPRKSTVRLIQCSWQNTASFRHIMLRNLLTLQPFRVMYGSGKERDFMPNLRKIEAAVPAIREKKTVAAYARVSMQSERMLHSLSAQVSYYSG